MKLRFEEAHRVARHVAVEKGGTFRVFENEHGAVIDTPPTGFVVGGAGVEMKVHYEEGRTSPDVETIYSFTERCLGNAFGIWLDSATNIWHFDEITILPNRQTALDLARDRKQIAIWDLERSEEIRLDDDNCLEAHLALKGAGLL